MKIKDLIKKLSKADPELQVFFRAKTIVGNVVEVDKVEVTTYGFFGKDVPCIILDKN